MAKQQSDHSANHDLLTGLPNRRAFHNELSALIDRCNSGGTVTSLLFIDLDRFKDVNDTLGHEAGDAVLQRWQRGSAPMLRARISWPGSAATSSRFC